MTIRYFACLVCGTSFAREGRGAPSKVCGPMCRLTHRRGMRSPTHHEPAPVRFAAKVEKSDGCWLWTGCVCSSTGYGEFWFDGRRMPAHRASYLMHRGEIPEGLQIDHLCRVRRCVNPDHLEAVTQQENIRRGWWATKTACIYGHAYTPENTSRLRSGARRCLACHRDDERQRRMAKNSAETGEATAYSDVLDITVPEVGEVPQDPRDRIAAKAAEIEAP